MKKGYFGDFGGCFVPELLMPPLMELEKAMAQNDIYRKQITELERTIDNLKLADAFKSGSDNTEARKKIDKLIKEIDKCITLMEG